MKRSSRYKTDEEQNNKKGAQPGSHDGNGKKNVTQQKFTSTIAAHVRYKSLYISVQTAPVSGHSMNLVFCKTGTTAAKFDYWCF